MFRCSPNPYSDPYVPGVKIEGEEFFAQEAGANAAAADCVLIVTDHKVFDYNVILEKAKLIVDTRNALKGFADPKIVRL